MHPTWSLMSGKTRLIALRKLEEKTSRFARTSTHRRSQAAWPGTSFPQPDPAFAPKGRPGLSRRRRSRNRPPRPRTAAPSSPFTEHERRLTRCTPRTWAALRSLSTAVRRRTSISPDYGVSVDQGRRRMAASHRAEARTRDGNRMSAGARQPMSSRKLWVARRPVRH
jgi:hypothetical protein